MTSEFGRGFSTTNLKLMRQFYLAYASRIGQTLSDLLPKKIGQAPSGQAAGLDFCAEKAPIQNMPLTGPASVSWSHDVYLMGLNNPDEHMFYEIESARQGWDVRTLTKVVGVCQA
jgi:hypothetical protein